MTKYWSQPLVTDIDIRFGDYFGGIQFPLLTLTALAVVFSEPETQVSVVVGEVEDVEDKLSYSESPWRSGRCCTGTGTSAGTATA